MGLFRSGKTMTERAQDERAKLDMKNIKVQQTRADVAQIEANRQRAEAVMVPKRLRA